jgi:RimJ/RimL family protein N-acetyltransferase
MEGGGEVLGGFAALAPWIHFGRSVLGSGNLGEVVRHARRRIYSTAEFLGFRRDLAVPFDAPPAKIPISVRPMAPGDVEAILPLGPGLPHGEWWEQATRRRLLEAQIGTCHVAVAPDGRPCYMLCVMGHADNARVQRYFGAAFPELAPHEALIEGAFTPAPFRGMGLMAAATALIAERAAGLGARHVLCFVARDNAASVKGCLRAGFTPETVRREDWRLFRRRSAYRPA